MKIIVKNCKCNELNAAIAALLEVTTKDHFIILLNELVDIYIVHAKVERIDLANTVSMVNDIKSLICKLDSLNKLPGAQSFLMGEDKIKCLHN